MPEIDPVILQLQADLKQYRSDLTGAQRLTETKLAAIEARGVAMGQNIRKGFDLAKGAAIGFLATVSVDALTQAAKRGLDYASSLGEVAQQLGVTTDALQEYRYAASQAGLSQEEMDQALSQLTRRIGEAASGTKAQAEAFTKLGISVKDANGNVMDAGRAIPMIADALQKIESPAERAAILMDLFGRAGQKLEPLLSGGSAAVNELRDAAHKLGIVLSEDQIQRADETADKLSALKTQIEALADAERDRIEQRRKAELEQDARDLAQERYSTDRDGLQIQYDLADSQTERKRLALEMLDLELRYQKALLEGVIASETATEAEKKRAQAALDGLNATASGKREAASRSNETPLEAYRRKLDRSPDAINEQVESYVVEELDNVRDGIRGALEKAIGTDDPLISGLLNLLIEQVILRPLAEALASASGGGGGFLGAVASGIGSLFGRASGGYVAPGQMVRVNEGASPGRVEGFIPQGGGHIVPLGRMNALRQAGGQKVFQISIDARNSVTPDGFARELSSQILRQAAAMDGQTAQAVLKAAPGRMSQYQRDKI